jgi:hypothetical protein
MASSEFAGTAKRLSFDLVAGDPTGNTAAVRGFSHDGALQEVLVQGGPIYGGLVSGRDPPNATITDGGFHNALQFSFDSLGVRVFCALELSENAPAGDVPDQLSAFLLNSDAATFPFPTVDPLGANALFSITVTGESGGELSFFAPMTFVPPDTLLFENSTVGVVHVAPQGDRVAFRTIAPIPSSHAVKIVYQMADPGGFARLRIYDVMGRLVAEPVAAPQAEGVWSVEWDARDRFGRPAPAGVYLLELSAGGQSRVRRIVLAR